MAPSPAIPQFLRHTYHETSAARQSPPSYSSQQHLRHSTGETGATRPSRSPAQSRLRDGGSGIQDKAAAQSLRKRDNLPRPGARTQPRTLPSREFISPPKGSRSRAGHGDSNKSDKKPSGSHVLVTETDGRKVRLACLLLAHYSPLMSQILSSIDHSPPTGVSPTSSRHAAQTASLLQKQAEISLGGRGSVQPIAESLSAEHPKSHASREPTRMPPPFLLKSLAGNVRETLPTLQIPDTPECRTGINPVPHQQFNRVSCSGARISPQVTAAVGGSLDPRKSEGNLAPPSGLYKSPFGSVATTSSAASSSSESDHHSASSGSTASIRTRSSSSAKSAVHSSASRSVHQSNICPRSPLSTHSNSTSPSSIDEELWNDEETMRYIRQHEKKMANGTSQKQSEIIPPKFVPTSGGCSRSCVSSAPSPTGTRELERPTHITTSSISSSAYAPTSRLRPLPPLPPQNDTYYTIPRRRPATIAELADRAQYDPYWDSSKDVKYWLKAGDSHRRAGKRYVEGNEIESAFVEYAKAATIVLEKLPSHPEYYTMLSAAQRYNLELVSVLFICLSHISVLHGCLEYCVYSRRVYA